jgi:hypothetical protein
MDKDLDQRHLELTKLHPTGLDEFKNDKYLLFES